MISPKFLLRPADGPCPSIPTTPSMIERLGRTARRMFTRSCANSTGLSPAWRWNWIFRRPGTHPYRFFTAPVMSVSAWVFSFGTLMSTSASAIASVSGIRRNTLASGISRSVAASSNRTDPAPVRAMTSCMPVARSSSAYASGVSIPVEGLSPMTHRPPAAAARLTMASTIAGWVSIPAPGGHAERRFGFTSTLWP